MPNKIKKYVTTGVTSPLVDGQTRTVTLVCLVEVKDEVETITDQFEGQKGKKRILTFVTEDVVKGTITTLHFGLAVLSPTDIALQAQADEAWKDAVRTLNTAEESGNIELIKAATTKRNELASKRNIVSPARGEEIAFGKAMKPKSALAIITTAHQFFTTHMIKQILAEKLKHICSDPNRFIRIAGPKQPTATVATLTPPKVEEPIHA